MKNYKYSIRNVTLKENLILKYFNHLAKLPCLKLACSFHNLVSTQWVRSNFPLLSKNISWKQEKQTLALSHQKEFYWKILGSHTVTGQLWESGQAGWGNEQTNGRARDYLQTHLARTELLDSSTTTGLYCSCTKTQAPRNSNLTFLHLGFTQSRVKVKGKLVHLDQLRRCSLTILTRVERKDNSP